MSKLARVGLERETSVCRHVCMHTHTRTPIAGGGVCEGAGGADEDLGRRGVGWGRGMCAVVEREGRTEWGNSMKPVVNCRVVRHFLQATAVEGKAAVIGDFRQR